MDFAKKLEENGNLIRDYPNINYFNEIAVRQNGLALKYIPVQNRTYKLCRIAILENPYAINLIDNPDNFLIELSNKGKKKLINNK